MKKFLTLVAASLCTVIMAADPAALLKEGAAALKAKDFTTALAKYTEAQNSAVNNVQKRNAIMGKFNTYIRQGKHADARKFMEAAVEDEGLKNTDVRLLLNHLATPYIWWPAQAQYAINILKQAQNVEVSKNSNEYYNSYFLLASAYGHCFKEYKTVIEVITPITQITGQHPANKYNAYMLIGNAHERLGNKEEALQAFKNAVAWGKKIPYKYNYSRAETAVERLSK